jgi:hypothetical protein
MLRSLLSNEFQRHGHRDGCLLTPRRQFPIVADTRTHANPHRGPIDLDDFIDGIAIGIGMLNDPAKNAGAKPAAISTALRARRGTSSRSARRRTISRLGCARPVSGKLTWRADTPACNASASCVRCRRRRQSRSRDPTATDVWGVMSSAYRGMTGRQRTSEVIDSCGPNRDTPMVAANTVTREQVHESA